jgi:septum formation protein
MPVSEVEIILASSSATRVALLRGAGVEFTARSPGVDERSVDAMLVARGMKPDAIAVALAEAKAIDVSLRVPSALVIGADQTLDFEGERWTKAGSHDEARQQLQRLSGRSHTLATAVAVAHAGTVHWGHVESPRLTMRALNDAEIDGYLSRVGKHALSSVGAYQIEGVGIQLFDKIEGDYFAILGLPLLPLLAYLRGKGALSLARTGAW